MELKLDNITKKYDKDVLHGINCTLTGGVYGLLGPNGAGKSTMIRLICNLEKPSGGGITYNGKGIDGLGGSYREILGYLPQNMGFYPDFTAREFLRYLAVMKGVPKEEQKNRVDEVLKLVNLADTGKKKIRNFSGGMKQRLGIAQAILNRPKILVLDEPTVGLDLNERMNFKQMISEYSSENIVIFATHIVSDVEDIGNEILIIKDGQMKEKAAPDELLRKMQGKVWLYECGKKEALTVKRNYKVSNMKVKADKAEFRLVSEHKPMEGASVVDANLQDLYLHLFGSVSDE